MGRLTARFPDFGVQYDGGKFRELIRALEGLFARVRVDDTLPAYSITGDATLGQFDETVLVDTSGGNVEVTLPEISDAMIREKREFEVVKIEAPYAVTITPSGTDTIVGAADAVVTVQWTALRMRATTGNWVLV